jgi:branched-chain amino acid transport system ATP-binding protein
MADETGLVVERLCAGYGRMTVVRDFFLSVRAGEVAAVLGRNGVGKSTALRAIAGLRHGQNSGSIRLNGIQLERLGPPAVVKNGLALVPEGHRLFTEMTLEENLTLGAQVLKHSIVLKPPREGLERIYDIFPMLTSMRKKRASSLSGGQQQMVAVGQALMAQPSCLLVDEPCAGLAPVVSEALCEAFRRLASLGLTVVLVDQDIARGLRYSDNTHLVEGGRVVHSGRSSQLDAASLADLIMSGRGVSPSKEEDRATNGDNPGTGVRPESSPTDVTL